MKKVVWYLRRIASALEHLAHNTCVECDLTDGVNYMREEWEPASVSHQDGVVCPAGVRKSNDPSF